MHDARKDLYVASGFPPWPDAVSRHTAYLTPCGTGYAQAGFCSTCDACGFDSITRESLGVLKFARDAARDPEKAEDIDKYGLGRFQAWVKLRLWRTQYRPEWALFSGTLRTARTSRDVVGALEIKKQLRKALAPPRAPQPVRVDAHPTHSIHTLKDGTAP